MSIIARMKIIDLGQNQPLITNNWKSQTLLLTRSGHESYLGLVVTKDELHDS